VIAIHQPNAWERVRLLFPALQITGIFDQPHRTLCCYFCVLFAMPKLKGTLNPKSFPALLLFSLGYWIAPLMAYFAVLLMVKALAR
jgi:hypothetical protein